MSQLAVIVMASGFGRRFGLGNKLLMPLKDTSVIEHTLSQVLEAHSMNEVILVTQYATVAERFINQPRIKICMNPSAKVGISASIAIGVEEAKDAKGYMFVPGDQVGLSSKTIRQLSQVFDAYPNKIIVPVYKGVFGSPKIFPASFRESLLALEGDQGGRSLMNEHISEVIEVVISDWNEHRDIDTYEDYCRIREDIE